MPPPTGDRDKPGKLYLGGLSFNTEEEKLRGLFQKFGKLADIQIIKDKVSNVSRGFGFVTYINPADGDDAVNGMDGVEVDGKYLKVAHALKAKHSEGRPDDRRGPPPSRGGSSSRGSRGAFTNRGRGRGGPLMDMGRGRGGSYRGRGGPPRSLMDHGDGEYASSRGAAPPLRSSRPPYGREEELEARRPSAATYQRKSRFEDLEIPERSTRPLSAYGRQPAAYDLDYDGSPAAREARLPASSYGREPDGYGSLPSERASRAPLASYEREPAAYGREAAVYGREEPAYAARQSSYPAEREGAAVTRHAVLEDPYAVRSREPALSDYPASRPVARDYPVVERSAARDPYARDPYAAVAREPAVARDYERARELPSAAPHEAYPQSRAYAAPGREPAARPARGLEATEYERPQAREFPSERNGSYGRERESRDPYGAAPTAGTSRYESYPAARDAYASAPRIEKPAYGARDPYGAAPAARSAYSRR